jgi:hypothetical protein
MRYRTAALAAAALLLLALANLPYGYYTFLRLVVSIVACFGLYRAFRQGYEGWALLLGGMALLFNPIIPVHLDRDLWKVLDLFAAACFLISAFRLDSSTSSVEATGVPRVARGDSKRR